MAIGLSLRVGPDKTDTVKERIDGNSLNTGAEETAPSVPTVELIALAAIAGRVYFVLF